MNADGQIVGVGDVAAQFEQALANVRTALDAAGAAPEHLASLTIYAVDLADFACMPARSRRYGEP